MDLYTQPGLPSSSPSVSPALGGSLDDILADLRANPTFDLNALAPDHVLTSGESCSRSGRSPLHALHRAGHPLVYTANFDMLSWAASQFEVRVNLCQDTAQELWLLVQKQMWDRMCLISHIACRQI